MATGPIPNECLETGPRLNMLKCNGLTISIRNLRVFTRIGVYEPERHMDREIVLNLEIKIHELGISISDQLCDTVDYATLASGLSDWMKTQSSHLIEHLAHLTILRVYEFDPKIASVQLEIFKPGCISNADGAVVKLSYSKNESLKYESARIN